MRRGTAAIYLGAPLPTRSCGATRGTGRTPLTPPISPCFGWGLPSFRHCCRNGELLPRLFTLAGADGAARRYVSVALSVGSPRPAVSGHPVRRSSDFPPRISFGATAQPPRPLSVAYIAARRHSLGRADTMNLTQWREGAKIRLLRRYSPFSRPVVPAKAGIQTAASAAIRRAQRPPRRNLPLSKPLKD